MNIFKQYRQKDLNLVHEENRSLLMEMNLDNDVAEDDVANQEKTNANKHSKESTKGYTVEDAVEHSGLGIFQVKMLGILGILSAADAMEMLLLSILGPALQCEWQLTSAAKALITTIVFIGFLLGSFFWGMVSDRFGRKTTFMLVMTIICYAGLLTSFSPTYSWLIVLRGLVGFGIGGAASSFTLLAEFLPSAVRAKSLILFQVWWALGSTFEVALAYLVLPHYGWRWLVALSSVPLIICAILILFLPESPRFLMNHGYFDKSQKVINDMLKANKKSALEGRLTNEVTVQPKVQISHLFKQEYRCTTLLLLVIWFGVTFSYYGIVLINSEYFNMHFKCYGTVKSTEFSHKPNETFVDNSCCMALNSEDYRSMILSSFGEFFVIPINFFLVDMIGRRKTISAHFLISGLLFGLLYACMPHIWATALMFGIRGLTSGIFNIVYIYTSEVFPTSARSTATGLCSSFARIAAILTPFVAQVLIPEVSLWGGLSIYAGLAVICSLSAICLPIETKGRPMPQDFKEIEIEMTKR